MRRASPANNWRILIIAKQLSQSYQGNGMNCWCVVKFHQNPYIHSIKQNEIVGRVLLGLQVVSLSAITFFTNSNICQLWRILLRYLFLIFVSSLPWKLISITLYKIIQILRALWLAIKPFYIYTQFSFLFHLLFYKRNVKWFPCLHSLI